MRTTAIAPILMAGAAAAAVALAPTAAASSNESQCRDNGMTSVCSKSGHAAIVATPGETRAGGGAYWPFGAGPTPPVWAMD